MLFRNISFFHHMEKDHWCVCLIVSNVFTWDFPGGTVIGVTRESDKT